MSERRNRNHIFQANHPAAGRKHFYYCMTSAELTIWLKSAAFRLGFSLCGVAPAVRPPGADRLDEWLAAGYAGEMGYLAGRREAYEHPRHVLDGVRSVVMLAWPYRTAEPVEPGPTEGRIARYAWGEADYHDLLRTKLNELAAELTVQCPEATSRGVVDTAPLMERDFAQLAGLGWIGKNTLLLNREQGSYFFLAALLTSAELQLDAPFVADHCGTCTACLDACPTQAFPQPYVLDARRCLSYTTIELKGMPPEELREHAGDWLFGCDVCQEVCPWNRKAPVTEEHAFWPQPTSNPVDLLELFSLTDDEFRARFRHTPLWRAKRRGVLRNAALVLGTKRPPEALAVLQAASMDADELVREAAKWAVGRYNQA